MTNLTGSDVSSPRATGSGVEEYKTCEYPPEQGVVTEAADPKPCREGGSLFRHIVSHYFKTGGDASDGRRKKVLIFYTPDNVWGPILFPDNPSLEGPTMGILEATFSDAKKKCQDHILVLLRGVSINASAYAQCISEHFQTERYQYHTILRGVALLADITNSGIAGYSALGRCSPAGFVFEIELDLPDEVRVRLPEDLHLWLIANTPVVVA